MYRILLVVLLAIISWGNLAYAAPDNIPTLAKARAKLKHSSVYLVDYSEEKDPIDGARRLEAYSCADSEGNPVTAETYEDAEICLGISRYYGNNHHKNSVHFLISFEQSYPDCEFLCSFKFNYNGNTARASTWKAVLVTDADGNDEGIYAVANASISTLLSPATKFVRFSVRINGEFKVYTIRTDNIDLRRLLTPTERKKLKL